MSEPSLDSVATGQRFIIYAIILNLAAMAVALILPSPVAVLAGLVNLAALILSVIGTFRLASGLGRSVGAKIGLVVLMFIPILNLITLLVVNSRATKKLRAAGYKVGFLGAKAPANA